MSKKLQQISVPLISVFLGILLGAIVMWIFGYDAIWDYEESRLHGRLDPRGGGHHLPFMGVLGDDSSQDYMAGRYGWQGSGQGLEGRWLN